MIDTSCWVCGSDTPRICWCHTPNEITDEQPCACRGNVVVHLSAMLDTKESGE